MSNSFSENVASAAAFEEWKEPPFVLEESKEQETERPFEEISYKRLSVSADKKCFGQETVDHLLEESKHTKDRRATNKANFKTGGQVTITINVDKPVLLVQYGLRSANDNDNRDPMQWELVAVNTVTGQS